LGDICVIIIIMVNIDDEIWMFYFLHEINFVA